MQEPFLALLVELDWASGRVVREYTFLLDPPGLPPAGATEPITPARAGTPARTSAAPAPRAPVATSSAGADRRGVLRIRCFASGGQYTVQRGDTLQKMRRSTSLPTSRSRMLAALFHGNQGAFEGNNMNRCAPARS